MPYDRADLASRSIGPIVSILVFAFSACALAQPPADGKPPVPSSVLTSYREMPVRLCVPVEPEAWDALRSGATRLVLHLQNQQPSARYSPGFLVSLVGADSKPGLALRPVSMSPDPAATGSPPAPQHFSFDLRKKLPASGSPPTFCIEVGIEASEENPPPDPGRRILIRASLDPVGR